MNDSQGNLIRIGDIVVITPKHLYCGCEKVLEGEIGEVISISVGVVLLKTRFRKNSHAWYHQYFKWDEIEIIGTTN